MSTQDNVNEHLTGRVKWFNNKAGYGFVTVTDGARSGMDVFVHHSDINVENQQYKYLVQGEYIEFDLKKVELGKHEWQASKISGIRGGKLMCETRRDLKLARNEYKTSKGSEEQALEETKMPRQKSVYQDRNVKPRARGEGPRATEEADNKKDWTLVRNKPKVMKDRKNHTQN
jgi:CspA family cold shock protein